MNYAQILEQIEQLKIGKKVPDTENILTKYSFKKVIYIPAEYEYDFVGELLEAILKEHRFSVGRFTPYAIKMPLGHIMYQGKNISQKDFTACAEEVFGVLESQTEVYWKIALKYFSIKEVDFLILPSFKKCSIDDLQEALSEAAVIRREKVATEVICSFLEKEGLTIKENQLNKALKKYKGEGRFELLGKKPYFLADGAQDGSSVKLLMAKLQYEYPNNPYIFIVGVLQDKYEEVIKESALMPQQIITVTPQEQANAVPAIDTAQEYGKLNPNITTTSSVEEAVEIAKLLADKNAVIVAFGTTAILDRYRTTVSKDMCSRSK